MGTIASTASATATATLTGDSWWLKDPLDPTRDTVVSVPQGGWRPSRPVHAGVFDVFGRDEPVVSDGGVGAVAGPLSVNAFTADDYDAVMLLLTSRRTLLLQNVLGQQWYLRVAGGTVDEEQVLARPTVTEASPVRAAWRLTAQMQEVAAP